MICFDNGTRNSILCIFPRLILIAVIIFVDEPFQIVINTLHIGKESLIQYLIKAGKLCSFEHGRSRIIKQGIVSDTKAFALLHFCLEGRILFPEMKQCIDIAVKGVVNAFADKAGSVQFGNVGTDTGRSCCFFKQASTALWFLCS